MGFEGRHRRAAQRRQVDAVQRADPTPPRRRRRTIPFCTIEPNVGEVAVPDPRLDQLAEHRQVARRSCRRASTFVDIAGLVRGASQGRRARQPVPRPTSARSTPSSTCCAASRTTTSPMSRAGSTRCADAETVETELMLADLESVEKRLAGLQRKRASGGDKEAQAAGAAARRRPKAALDAGKPARDGGGRRGGRAAPGAQLQLLTAKPVLYVCNVEEAAAATGNAHVGARWPAMAAAEGAGCVVDLGRDRGGDRAAATTPSAASSSADWGWRSPGSTG